MDPDNKVPSQGELIVYETEDFILYGKLIRRPADGKWVVITQKYLYKQSLYDRFMSRGTHGFMYAMTAVLG